MPSSGADTDAADADATDSADAADERPPDEFALLLRRVLGSLQLPIASIGLIMWVLSSVIFASLFGKTPEGEGFIHGGALLFSYALAVAGYALFAVGLAIPPGPGFGIHFRRKQRLCFVGAAVAAVASVVLPLALLPTALGGNANPIFYAWVTTTSLAILGVAAGLAWRGGEWIGQRRDTG